MRAKIHVSENILMATRSRHQDRAISRIVKRYWSRRFRDYGLKLSPLPDVYFHFDLYIRPKWIKNDAEQLRRNSTAAGTEREVIAGQRNLWRHATSPNFTPRRGGKYSTREYIFANSSRFLSNVTLCPVLRED